MLLTPIYSVCGKEMLLMLLRLGRLIQGKGFFFSIKFPLCYSRGKFGNVGNSWFKRRRGSKKSEVNMAHVFFL